MNKKLKTSLKKFNKKKEDKLTLWSGELGIPLNGTNTVEVPGRQGFVFVRLKGNTSELIQAYNAAVSPIYGLPVLLARQTGVYKIIGRNLDRYQDWGDAPYLPKHGGQHSFNPQLNIGGDVAWIYSQQFMPLLSYPSGTYGGMTLSIEPHFYEWNGSWRYAQNTGTPSYAPYLPTITGSARMVLSYIDPVDNSIKLVPGTPFSNLITGSAQIAPYIPDIPRSVGIPLAAVRLITGTTTIGWNNIYDVRDFYTVGTASGSSGGAGGGIAGLVGQDEGVFVGTGTILNVTGAGATLSFSGTVLNLNVPGGGSANPPVTGSIVVLDDMAVKGSVLNLNFGSLLTATISGSYAQIDAALALGRTDDLTSQINGTGTSFNLPYTPIDNTLRLFYNGVRQRLTFNYTVSGATIQTLFVPATGSVLIADYGETASTGTYGFAVQDEGVSVGHATALNVVGASADISVSNGVARLFITGSSSGGGGRTLISSVSPSGTGTVVFSSIPGTYSSLEIEYTARSTRAALADELICQANGDTTATNYRHTKLQGYGAGTAGASGGDVSNVADISGASSPANSAGGGKITIPIYAEATFNKNFIGHWTYRNDAATNHLAVGTHGVEWENTAAITQIVIRLASANFVAGSTFRLYGVP